MRPSAAAAACVRARDRQNGARTGQAGRREAGRPRHCADEWASGPTSNASSARSGKQHRQYPRLVHQPGVLIVPRGPKQPVARGTPPEAVHRHSEEDRLPNGTARYACARSPQHRLSRGLNSYRTGASRRSWRELAVAYRQTANAGKPIDPRARGRASNRGLDKMYTRQVLRDTPRAKFDAKRGVQACVNTDMLRYASACVAYGEASPWLPASRRGRAVPPAWWPLSAHVAPV